MLIDVCAETGVPTLREAINNPAPKQLFMSVERLEPCDAVYSEERVSQEVRLEFGTERPVQLQYHTTHIVSDTGRMTLAEGAPSGYSEAIIGLLHRSQETLRIEPLVIGAPMLDHPRNGPNRGMLDWHARTFGEVLPEDIDEFSQMKGVQCVDASEWLDVMRSVAEATVKQSFAALLKEPTKKDWGGETNDHFSSNVHLDSTRRTAAFLLKGPSNFSEMTPRHCGKNGDQIYRLTNSGADISIVQHSHLIGEAVRAELRAFVMQPGPSHRKYCFIDGQATYRILKAYGFI